MNKIVSSDSFLKGLNLCQKGKHKLRENTFGIVWCVRCGLLSTSVGTAQKLDNEDKITIKNEYYQK